MIPPVHDHIWFCSWLHLQFKSAISELSSKTHSALCRTKVVLVRSSLAWVVVKVKRFLNRNMFHENDEKEAVTRAVSGLVVPNSLLLSDSYL